MGMLADFQRIGSGQGMSHFVRRICMLLTVACALSLGACASTEQMANTNAVGDVNDPFEPFNRQMFAINKAIDDVAIRPVAQGYRKLPQFAQTGIYNFLRNLREPVTITNDILQWEWKRALKSVGRFGINSTVGLAGFIDQTTPAGLEYHKEDFGQTLAVWGVPEGNYGYLPIFGPAPTRDGLAYFVDLFFDPLIWIGGADLEALFWTNTVLGGLDTRARNFELLDELEGSSVDFYASVRSLYRQTRERDIANGVQDFSDLPDFDEFDEFDEDF